MIGLRFDKVRHRRGSIYIMVLIVTMIVTMIGMASLSLARIATRTSGGGTAWIEAQALARAGLEFGLLDVRARVAGAEGADLPWREAFSSGVMSGAQALGRGTFEWVVIDIDSDIRDDPTDPLWLVARGTVDDAVYSMAVQLVPDVDDSATPLSCLDAALVSQDFDIQDGRVDADHILHTNSWMHAQGGADVYADAEAVTSILGNTWHGSRTTGVTLRDMPTGDVYNHYINYGTTIGYDDISASVMNRILLSPANNPYGMANATGIYVVDCAGGDLTIRDSRIVGTLVVLNAGTVRLEGSLTWEAAYANYPALMVQGDLHVATTLNSLSETSTLTNFNPPGTPWQTTADGDATDSYPSAVDGLIFVEDEFRIPSSGGALTLYGVLIVGNSASLSGGTYLDIVHNDTFAKDPPPGFRRAEEGSRPRVVAGSLQRVTNKIEGVAIP